MSSNLRHKCSSNHLLGGVPDPPWVGGTFERPYLGMSKFACGQYTQLYSHGGSSDAAKWGIHLYWMFVLWLFSTMPRDLLGKASQN